MKSLLSNHRSCLPRASLLALLVNIVISLAIGVRMPPPAKSTADVVHQRCDGWCTIPQRPLHDPPFWFFEFRHCWLSIAIAFSVIRLIFDGAKADISVIVVIARMVGLIAQLQFTTWLCTNWKKFFIDKEILPLLSFLSYASLAFLYVGWSLAVIQDQNSTHFVVRLVFAILAMVVYYWSKHWVFAFGPTDPERRFVGGRFYAAVTAALSCAVMVGDFLTNGPTYAANSGFIEVFVLSSFNVAVYHMQERRRAGFSLNIELEQLSMIEYLQEIEVHSAREALSARQVGRDTNDDADDDADGDADDGDDMYDCAGDRECGKESEDCPAPTVPRTLVPALDLAPGPVPARLPGRVPAPSPSATVACAGDDATSMAGQDAPPQGFNFTTWTQSLAFKHHMSANVQSLKKHKADEFTAHLVHAKVSALTCQVFLWYGLVFFAENILCAVYEVEGCDEFDFDIDPLALLQQFVDSIV